MLDYQRFKRLYQIMPVKEQEVEEEVFRPQNQKPRETGIVRVQARVRGYLVRKELEIVRENR
jgi:hypothetical protein